MKKLLFLSFITLHFSAYTQAQVAKIDSGKIDGATYRILFPENWKGKLVMFAHGYEFVGATKFTTRADFQARMAVYTSRGYTVAASPTTKTRVLLSRKA